MNQANWHEKAVDVHGKGVEEGLESSHKLYIRKNNYIMII